MTGTLVANGMQKFNIQGFGLVTVRKSKKAKRISIRIRHDQPVEVVIPWWTSYNRGKAFALQKKDWIQKHTDRLSGMREKIITHHTIIHTPAINIHFRFLQNSTGHTRASYTNGVLRVEYDRRMNVCDDSVQQIVKQYLMQMLRKEALAYLPERLAQLARQFGFQYNRVSIRNQKTLWGSCSNRNNINLNLHLILLPSHLIDYVLVHELVHTRHKNHGPDFWSALNHCLGDGKAFARELRQFSIGLLH